MSKNSKFSTTERDKIAFEQSNNNAKNKAYLERKTTNARNMDNLNTGFSVFTLIVTILIGICLIRILSGYDGLTFASFLEMLSNAPDITMSLSSTMQYLHISGEWTILDGLRVFLNSLMSMFSISLWCVSGLAQCILYFGYFLAFIFVG